MPNIVTTLLDFILDLLHDPKAAQAFQSDPHAAIAASGLQGVTPGDVHSAMQMVGDCSPVSWGGPGNQYMHVAAYQSPLHHASSNQAPWQPEHCDDDDKDHKPQYGDHDNHEMAVMQHVEYDSHNTYTETNTITYTEVNASHSVFAGGDANVLFGDHDQLVDNGGVALNDTHGPVEVDNSHPTVDVSLQNSLNGSFNDVSGNGSAAGNGNTVNTDSGNPVNTDSGNTGSLNTATTGGTVNAVGHDQLDGNTVKIADHGSQVGDNPTTTTTAITDSTVADHGSQSASNGAQLADQGGQNADKGGQIADHGAQIAGDGGQNAGDGGQNADHGSQVAGAGLENVDHGSQIGDDTSYTDSHDDNHATSYVDSFDDSSEHHSTTIDDSLNHDALAFGQIAGANSGEIELHH